MEKAKGFKKQKPKNPNPPKNHTPKPHNLNNENL